MRSLFLAWINFQRRIESMQYFFGYEIAYLRDTGNPSSSRLARYWRLMTRTLRLLSSSKPDLLWVQLPPNFIPHIIELHRLVFRGKYRVVYDCHNATFQAPWNKIPFAVWAMNRADAVFVHNQEMLDAAARYGIDRERLHVLEDQAPVFDSTLSPTIVENCSAFFVMPCSFHDDEPIEAVFAAAAACPDYKFMLTGNRERAEKKGFVAKAPANVIFTGFLDTVDFNCLVLGATGILCLTTKEGIQLSAASEALAAGRPLILSDTAILRTLFGSASVVVDNSPASLIAAFHEIAQNAPRYADQSTQLYTQRRQRWETRASPLRDARSLA